MSALALLDASLMLGLPILFQRLATSLQPSLVEGLSSLPHELRRQYVTADGRFRVQVFPRPMALAFLLTAAAWVWLGVPLNTTDAPRL